jgi:hypothetical protein
MWQSGQSLTAGLGGKARRRRLTLTSRGVEKTWSVRHLKDQALLEGARSCGGHSLRLLLCSLWTDQVFSTPSADGRPGWKLLDAVYPLESGKICTLFYSQDDKSLVIFPFGGLEGRRSNSRFSYHRHPRSICLAGTEAVFGIKPLGIRRRQCPVGDSRKFGVGQDDFDQRFAKPKPAHRGLNEDIRKMGAKGIIGE